jgi:hypothetical protein
MNLMNALDSNNRYLSAVAGGVGGEDEMLISDFSKNFNFLTMG